MCSGAFVVSAGYRLDCLGAGFRPARVGGFGVGVGAAVVCC